MLDLLLDHVDVHGFVLDEVEQLCELVELEDCLEPGLDGGVVESALVLESVDDVDLNCAFVG